MMAPRPTESLLDRLPAPRGRLRPGVPLARFTWFRVGGPAEALFEPADEADLADFLAACPQDVPVTVLAAGSNVLVRDGGIPGVVVRLGRTFATVRSEGDCLFAGAGASCPNVAKAARNDGLAGLEFLTGVPGSIGGALCMNAGAYGREIKDLLEEAVALDGAGQRHTVPAAAMGFSYRHAEVPADWIFVGARLRGHPDDWTAIARRMTAIQARREADQPIRARTGGSTFTNPEGLRAWELIDKAGCRGLRRGGAMVSEKHCNFLVNTGAATADDLEGLGEEVRRRVFLATRVRLAWEIRRIGRPARNGPAAVAP